MERYAPTLKDLAPRDMVSRFMYEEIRAGRGIDGKDYLHLDLTPPRRRGHREQAARHHRLRPDLPGPRPDQGARPDPADRALRDGRHPDRHRRPSRRRRAQHATSLGLYAAGECACVSVHGANRLGTNSLVDIIVFGRRGGRAHGRLRRSKRTCPRCPHDPEGRAQRRDRAAPERHRRAGGADLAHDCRRR